MCTENNSRRRRRRKRRRREEAEEGGECGEGGREGEEFWTWEEILDGKGPWAQPGQYRRPKEELEAVKAERRWYEEAARRRGWKPESQPQKFLGGGSQGAWRRQV